MTELDYSPFLQFKHCLKIDVRKQRSLEKAFILRSFKLEMAMSVESI